MNKVDIIILIIITLFIAIVTISEYYQTYDIKDVYIVQKQYQCDCITDYKPIIAVFSLILLSSFFLIQISDCEEEENLLTKQYPK